MSTLRGQERSFWFMHSVGPCCRGGMQRVWRKELELGLAALPYQYGQDALKNGSEHLPIEQ